MENNIGHNFNELVGQTIQKITGAEKGSDIIKFYLSDGRIAYLQHEQDCCESVEVKDICGDIQDLIGVPIARASEDSNNDEPQLSDSDESWTWTFYNIGTSKGHVTIRWYGTSNGYYSESVTFGFLDHNVQ